MTIILSCDMHEIRRYTYHGFLTWFKRVVSPNHTLTTDSSSLVFPLPKNPNNPSELLPNISSFFLQYLLRTSKRDLLLGPRHKQIIIISQTLYQIYIVTYENEYNYILKK